MGKKNRNRNSNKGNKSRNDSANIIDDLDIELEKTDFDNMSDEEIYERVDSVNTALSAMVSANQNDGSSSLGSIVVSSAAGWLITRFDRVVRKIVELPVMYMLKEKFYVEDDPENTVLNYYNSLQMNKHFKKLLSVDRITGLGLLVLNIEDSNDKESPLNYKTIKKIVSVKIYQKDEVRVDDVVTDKEDSRFGMAEKYTIETPSGRVFKIHHSRCYLLEGELIQDSDKLDNYNIGGDSIFTGGLQYISNYWDSSSSAGKILQSYIQLIITIKGLQDMVGKKNGFEKLKKRFELMKKGIMIQNLIPLDENETFKRESSSVSGVSDLIEKTEQQLSAVYEIPYSLFWGKTKGGLNKGDDEISNWRDKIEYMQQDKLFDVTYFITNIIISASEYKTKSELPIPVFNSLDKLSAKEEIEAHKTQAETDHIEIEDNKITSLEARQSRYGGGKYSFSTKIDEKNNSILSREKASGDDE